MILLAAAAEAKVADLGWMSGYWLSCENGREVSETWSDPRGGLLIGNSIAVDAKGKASFELARIAPSAGGLSFFAQPGGQAAAEFPLKSADGKQAVFENPAHDFPQRVIYRREGDRLIGRIEGRIDGKEQSAEWNYRSAPLNERCGK